MAENVVGWVVRDDLPDPGTSPELFEGVLSRRVLAFLVDMLVLLVLMSAVAIVLAVGGIVTFGLAWLGYFIFVPAVIIFYYATTLGSPMRATLGMKALDLVLTPTRTKPLDGVRAVLHRLVLWLTTTFLTPVILLVGLFTPRRQLLHDLIVGTLMVRRSPMERFWASEAIDHPLTSWERKRYT